MIPRGLCNFLRSSATSFRQQLFSSSPHRAESSSNVSFDRDRFKANLDVQDFQAGDISVEVAENSITIEGRQDERRDDQTYVSRHFVKKYVLPQGYYDMNRVETRMSSDGILTVTAPKLQVKNDECCRKIVIVQTGRPYIDD